ncbi:MAG: hypothetical protein Q4D63_07370 [Neisseria animaloris]|nr:hypothetical protein [Neisseria animaloris]
MKKHTILLAAALAAASASATEIHIAHSIPYQDESRIDRRITSECTKIGEFMSESVAKNAAKQGITVVRTAEDLSGQHTYAKIEIDSAVSAGSAYIGHSKSISIYAELIENGEVVRKTSLMRHSGGGFMGGFKGSCAVLNRTANVLGKDIAKWLGGQESR